jgi:hypothetical protein
VATGCGDENITVMVDTDFVLDLAKKTGAWLQYTAGDEPAELHYIRDGMKKRGLDVPLWVENVGRVDAVHPDQLANAVVQNGLAGMDYINGRPLIEADNVTPTPLATTLKAQVSRVTAAAH